MSAWTDEQPTAPLTKFPGKTGQRGVTFPGVIPAVRAASGTSSTWCWYSGCHTARPAGRTAVSPLLPRQALSRSDGGDSGSREA